MLRIDKIEDFETFLSLKNAWNSLVEKSSINSIFLSHEWIRCWWEAYGQGNQLSILLFQEGNDLKGIAPLMISKVFFRGLPVKRISFIENDETPHCGLIDDPSYEVSAIIEALFNFLGSQESKWDIVFLRKIHQESNLFRYMQPAVRKRGYRIIIRPIFCSPILHLNLDWKNYYTGKSQRFKKKIRYDQNKLKRAGHFKTQLFDTPEQIKSIMDDVFRVGCRSWKAKIGNSIGSTRRNRSFFSGLPHALNKVENGILLWTLSLDDKLISFEYHVRQNSTVYALRGEYDGEYQSFGPGSVLDFEVVRTLFKQGYQRYDMCGDSTDQYKLRWTSEVQPYDEIIVFKRGPYAKILTFGETHVTPIAKRYLNLIRNRHSRS